MDRVCDEYALGELSVSGIDGVVLLKPFEPAKVHSFDAFDRKVYTVDGIKVEIKIPFIGPGELWKHRASQYLIGGYPEVDIADDHFVFVMAGPDLDENQVRTALQQSIDTLQRVADWINHDTRIWSAELRRDLEAAAQARSKRLERAAALTQAIGIPVAPSAPEKQIPIPVKRRPLHRPAAPTSTSRASRPAAQSHTLQDDVYQDVLRTIEQMGRAMERTPTAAKLEEEELRNLILIVLNANYEGAVHGEVFNGKGLTDLLLNWEGDNAFIGECKMWDGPAKFHKAINQLLGYVTWRDTKAALIVFIKKGTPADVIRKARNEVETHASFVRLKTERSETRFDYLLQSPSDAERHIDLALIAVVMIPQS